MAACFVAGAAGDWQDTELSRGVLGAGKFLLGPSDMHGIGVANLGFCRDVGAGKHV